jgi:hypothetical protein
MSTLSGYENEGEIRCEEQQQFFQEFIGPA